MINRVYIAVLLLLVVGCSKINDSGAGSNVDDQISYRVTDLEADWTRGTSIDSASEIGDMIIYGVRYSGEDDRYIYIDAMTASKSSSANVWSFATTQYYPLAGDALSFWACTPLPIESSSSDNEGNGVTYSFDLETDYDDETSYNEESEVLRVDYTVPTIDARNQPDILVGTATGSMTSSANLVFSHMLTKVSLSAKLSSIESSTGVSYVDRYVITQFTMQHIATKGTLLLQEGRVLSQNDSGEWIIDQLQRETIITSTAYTLASPDEDASVKLDATDYQYVMVDSEGNKQALFMLPQRIDNLTSDVYGYNPTIFVTIYDIVDEIYYRTSELSLPTPDQEGWKAGEHINMQITIDPESSNLSPSMTIQPVILGWYDHEVEVEIDENITLWCDVNEISSGDDAIVKVYTNCSSISASVDTANCSVGTKVDSEYFPVTISGASAGEIVLSVTATNAYTGGKLTKNFKLTVN